MKIRKLERVFPAVDTSDGAGVKLRRSLGVAGFRVDPFLMLDEFSSSDPNDYVAGFPAHPHRGFETVTYLIEGHMLHEDHLGNRGDLENGGVQWMTAGRGIIHSEMPQQAGGRMRGFQLWLNLPAKEKMQPPGYQDISDGAQPRIPLVDGGEIRVIAGNIEFAGAVVRGVVNGHGERSTDPLYLDVRLAPNGVFEAPLADTRNAFVYLYEGDVQVADAALPRNAAGVLGAGDGVHLVAGADGARLLLIAGRPIGEPIEQYGPFVMNTRAEVEAAMRDYQSGALTAA